MPVNPATSAAAASPFTVGLWIELDPSLPAPACCDERIRRVRGLVVGLDALPEVGSILLPCLPSDVPTIKELFAKAGRPGQLISDKLRVVAAGRDANTRRGVIAWAERRRDACRDRLADLGATASPRSWSAAIARLAEEPRRGAFATARRIIKLARLWTRLQFFEAILSAAGLLPPPQASVVADLRHRGTWARWIVSPAETVVPLRLRGPKILDVGVRAPPTARSWPAFRRLAEAADAVVASSRPTAKAVSGLLGGRVCHVMPPAPLAVSPDTTDEQTGRHALADELREFFSNERRVPLHRHFCDFPFERVEYLVAVTAGEDNGSLLPAFATVLRRHRRSLTLLIDGRMSRCDGPLQEIERLGLSFDVAEVAGLAEMARTRLLQYARAVVVADHASGYLPAAFGEAVALGTPVVIASSSAAREMLTADELVATEYYDASGGAAALALAILHAIDRREEVLARQRAIIARLSTRTWAAAAADVLRLLERASSETEVPR